MPLMKKPACAPQTPVRLRLSAKLAARSPGSTASSCDRASSLGTPGEVAQTAASSLGTPGEVAPAGTASSLGTTSSLGTEDAEAAADEEAALMEEAGFTPITLICHRCRSPIKDNDWTPTGRNGSPRCGPCNRSGANLYNAGVGMANFAPLSEDEKVMFFVNCKGKKGGQLVTYAKEVLEKVNSKMRDTGAVKSSSVFTNSAWRSLRMQK